jgi:hypothetical protein
MICSTLICTKCKKPKPSTEFRRLLSRAQAKAKGYVANHRVEVETTRCKACQPKPTPFKRMSKKALTNAVAAGDLSQLMMNLILQEREENNKVEASRKTKERWHEAYSNAWRDVVSMLSKEVYHIRDQEKHAKITGHISRLHYAQAYLDVLNKLRARLRIKAAKPEAAPHSVYWQDHTTPEEVDKVQTAWTAIPFELRTKGRGMRQPLILTHRALPAEEVKPVVRLANGGETLDNPAARLAQGGEEVNPLTKMTDAELNRLVITGSVDSRIVNVILEERKKRKEVEALGRADEAFNKRVAKRIAGITKK